MENALTALSKPEMMVGTKQSLKTLREYKKPEEY